MPIHQGSPRLHALRKWRKRAATQEEMETARPFFRKGEGKAGRTGVLLVHGFTVTPANFRQFAEALAQDGYTVSVPLLPGHGTRPEDLVGVRWEQWLEAVAAAHDKLQETCGAVFVAGISLGGALALQLARARQTIRKLFLLAPAVYPLPILEAAVRWLLPWLRRLGLRYWMHVAGDVKRRDGFELGYGKTALDGLSELVASMRSTQRILPEVTTDVLIFQGRTDHEVPAKRALLILQRLGSRNKGLVWLENSFHEIPRDGDAPLVLRRIREEIRTLSA